MNIKISIREGALGSSVFSHKEISTVQQKKKAMLYAPPERDIVGKETVVKQVPSRQKQIPNKTETKMYEKSQKEMLEALKANSKNGGVTADVLQNNTRILQKQSEILQQNQKVISQQLKNQSQPSVESAQLKEFTRILQKKFDEIGRELSQIKKIKEQLTKMQKDEQKQQNNEKNNNKNLIEMQNNWKNMVQNSKNQIEGLENMEGIKQLQNFNIEGYSQAISSLKRQIAQYQKQSENIERELKIRAAKLQKLQISPKFQEQLYRPYQQHLNRRVKNIDLHQIRDRIYQKIGTFDYGKFQYQVSTIMNQAKSQLANFSIVCKQHQILVPDFKIDQKQLKAMDVKIPSVLDQYKAARGIKFQDPAKQNKGLTSNLGGGFGPTSTNPGGFRMSKTNEIQQRLRQTNVNKKPTNLQSATRTLDLAHEVKLSKQNERKPTILQNQDKKQRREFQKRMKETTKVKDQEFDKYLETRAREQLAILYKEKEERLKKMENQLYQSAKNPDFVRLQLEDTRMVQKKSVKNIKQEPKKEDQNQEENYEDDEFEKQSNQEKKNIPNQEKKITQNNIKQLGRDILKSKLKSLLADKQPSRPQSFQQRIVQENQQIQGNQSQENQLQGIAEGFLNMINNTLTQVNATLSSSIEKRISRPKPSSLERPVGPKIQVPKLEAFAPPPTFNMTLMQQPQQFYYPQQIPQIPQIPEQRVPEKKIVVENYDKYQISDESDLREYEISSQDDQI